MSELLRVVGSVAGLAGLAVGMIVILFREVIRKQIFPQLPRRDAYRLLRMIVFLAWTTGVLGIVAWVYVSRGVPAPGARADNGVQADPPPLVIAGTVVDEGTNRGLGAASIAIDQVPGVQITEDSGNFRILLKPMSAPPERVRLHVSKPGYLPLDRSVLPPLESFVVPLKKD